MQKRHHETNHDGVSGTDYAQIRVSPKSLQALKDLKNDKNLDSLDSALTLLLRDRQSSPSGSKLISERLAELQEKASALMELSIENLIQLERLEAGAIRLQIASCIALSDELTAFAAATKGKR